MKNSKKTKDDTSTIIIVFWVEVRPFYMGFYSVFFIQISFLAFMFVLFLCLQLVLFLWL